MDARAAGWQETLVLAAVSWTSGLMVTPHAATGVTPFAPAGLAAGTIYFRRFGRDVPFVQAVLCSQEWDFQQGKLVGGGLTFGGKNSSFRGIPRWRPPHQLASWRRYGPRCRVGLGPRAWE